MILEAAKYGYLDTRVALLGGRLFPYEAFEQLVDQPIADQTHLLEQARLERLAGDITGAEVERAIVAVLLDELAIVLRPLRGAAREFIKHWMRRFELRNLKVVIRGKVAGRSPDAVLAELVDLGPMASLPSSELARTEHMEELLHRLQGSPYGDMARRAWGSYEEQHDLFALEAVLDREYFIGLQHRRSSLDSNDRAQVGPLVDRLLDQINLVWMLRYRFAYGLEAPHTFFLLAPGGRYMNAATLLRLLRLEPMEEVLKSLPAGLKEGIGEASTITEVERALAHGREQAAYRILRLSRFNLGRAIAYLMIRERQLYRIHAAIRGEQLGLDVGLVREGAGLGPAISGEVS